MTEVTEAATLTPTTATLPTRGRPETSRTSVTTLVTNPVDVTKTTTPAAIQTTSQPSTREHLQTTKQSTAYVSTAGVTWGIPRTLPTSTVTPSRGPKRTTVPTTSRVITARTVSRTKKPPTYRTTQKSTIRSSESGSLSSLPTDVATPRAYPNTSPALSRSSTMPWTTTDEYSQPGFPSTDTAADHFSAVASKQTHDRKKNLTLGIALSAVGAVAITAVAGLIVYMKYRRKHQRSLSSNFDDTSYLTSPFSQDLNEL